MRSGAIFAVFFSLGLLTSVSAHGGGSTTGLEPSITTGQTLLISLVGGVAAFQLTTAIITVRSEMLSPLMVGLAAYTGIMHLLLGMEDSLLLLGGFGVLGLLAVLTFFELPPQRERLAVLALCVVVVCMFVGYFLNNHGAHMVLEDRLGLTAKISELLVLGLAFRSIRSSSTE